MKVTDEAGNVGWGEASLEGHTQAVEGCLDSWFEKFQGTDAEYGQSLWRELIIPGSHADYQPAKSSTFGKVDGARVSTAEDRFS